MVDRTESTRSRAMALHTCLLPIPRGAWSHWRAFRLNAHTGERPVRIVFHGVNAHTFETGFSELTGGRHDLVLVPDMPTEPGDVEALTSAEVVVGVALSKTHPRLERIRLYHAPAAGIDAIDRSCLPEGVPLCNAPGHEQAIAEYVIAALLQRYHPLRQADAELRKGKWSSYWAGLPTTVRPEMSSATLGVLGYGHIGKVAAARAKAFGMRVTVANRSPVSQSASVDEYYGLDQIGAFMASADNVLVTLPLSADTQGLIGAAALAAMRPDAWIINVGRGAVIDEMALFEVLAAKRIGGAVIDTWYQYPGPGRPETLPSRLPFHDLGNIIMTPHMSGWTHGTVRRRQEVMADNIERLERGEALTNRV